MRSELNPNHPVTQEMRNMWHKIAAVLLRKFGKTKVLITVEDFAAMDEFLQGGAICIHPSGDILEVFLVDAAEAQRLAREEGGMPV